MIRRSTAAVRDLVARIAAPFIPEPGTAEGAVMLGLVMLGAAFTIAGNVPMALGVPGAVLVLVGVVPALRGRS